MIVKVCGMRHAENIRAVEQLFTAHSSLFTAWMGFIFWPKSSRYVSQRPDYLPTQCKRVGVFVDEDPEQVKRLADDYGLDYIQLHGQESPSYISRLGGLHVIKAFNIATAEDLLQTQPYEGLVDGFLFDAKGKSVGGNGEKFDWTVLDGYVDKTPFLLSGGIGPDDTAQVNAFIRGDLQSARQCIGIDLNSRFELSPGLKDINKLKVFLKQLNS